MFIKQPTTFGNFLLFFMFLLFPAGAMPLHGTTGGASDVLTANFGATSYVIGLPIGFSNW